MKAKEQRRTFVFSIIAIGLAMLVLQTRAGYTDVSFVDVTKNAGLDALGLWEGATFGDYDNDGDLDLYIARTNGSDAYCENVGSGKFKEKSKGVGIKNPGFGVSAISGDYDNDGDLDIYVTVINGRNQLYSNTGKGMFEEIADKAGVTHLNSGQGAAFVDYDNDSDLDIFALDDERGAALYQNVDNNRFVNVTKVAGMNALLSTIWMIGAVWADFDDDGDEDVYIARGLFNPDMLYRNNGDGAFTDISKQAGVNALQGSAGPAVGDYDNDGDFDIYVANYSGQNRLYRNNGDGTFVEVAKIAGVGDNGLGISSSFGDYDNDGDLDLYVTNFGNNLLYRNNADGTFTDVSKALGVDDSRNGWSAVFVDINDDGALDLLVTNGGWQGNNQSCVLYQNRGSTNHWLHIRLVGIESNRDGIGARIRVDAGPLSMIREVSGGSGWGHQDTLLVEFGLSGQVQADEVEIRWPSGQVQRFANIPADQIITVIEGTNTIGGLAVQPNGKQLTILGKVKAQLYQNYPNPFNPETWIPFSLAEGASVIIHIYDINGGLVRRFELGQQGAGNYTARDRALYWDGRNDAGERVSSGIYFYQLRTGDFTAVRRLVIIK